MYKGYANGRDKLLVTVVMTFLKLFLQQNYLVTTSLLGFVFEINFSACLS